MRKVSAWCGEALAASIERARSIREQSGRWLTRRGPAAAGLAWRPRSRALRLLGLLLPLALPATALGIMQLTSAPLPNAARAPANDHMFVDQRSLAAPPAERPLPPTIGKASASLTSNEGPRAAAAVAPAPAVAAVPVAPIAPVAAPVLAPAPDRTLQTGKDESDETARKLLVRGDQFLADGDVAAARSFFKRAADSGEPQAAIAMGATYDPSVLGQLRVHGLKPDAATARHWYQRAADLGSKDAQDRLDTLARFLRDRTASTPK